MPPNILITGASRGLGAAIAAEFWANGSTLLLAARDAARLASLRDSLLPSARPGQHIHILPADLADPATPTHLLASALSLVPRLDVLVNNAAIVGPIGPFASNSPAAFAQTLQVNLLAPAELMRAAIPSMAASGGGVIINLSGGGATSPRPNFSAYATAKAALVRLSETIAVEYASANIRVHCVAPGAMNTEMLEAVLRSSPEAVGPEFRKALEQKEKGGADPAIAARLCVYLASPQAQHISGRLLSAVWDPWTSLHTHADDLAAGDIYTLRRIVPEDRGKNWS